MASRRLVRFRPFALSNCPLTRDRSGKRYTTLTPIAAWDRSRRNRVSTNRISARNARISSPPICCTDGMPPFKRRTCIMPCEKSI